MNFKEIQEYAKYQNERIGTHYNLEDERTRILAQMVKVTEEVGELANEILASQQLQRHDKLAATEKENLAKEFADVVFCTMILASNFDIDMEKALSEKMETVKQRHA